MPDTEAFTVMGFPRSIGSLERETFKSEQGSAEGEGDGNGSADGEGNGSTVAAGEGEGKGGLGRRAGVMSKFCPLPYSVEDELVDTKPNIATAKTITVRSRGATRKAVSSPTEIYQLKNSFLRELGVNNEDYLIYVLLKVNELNSAIDHY
jgi:hypothetical protein